jgi:hypothetical protein
MNSNVRQYDFPARKISISLKKRLALFLSVVCLAFLLGWAADSLFRWPYRRSFFGELIFPVMLATAFAIRAKTFLQPFSGGSLLLADNFVESRSKARWFTVKKRIYRDGIRSITENKYGLLIKDRGEFAARMLGFVIVPATLPEYQDIRSELAQWAPIKVKS